MEITMATILTDLGLVVTAVVGMVGEIVTEIVSNPLLLIGFGIGLLGAGVALVRRFS